jgi:hypothetical protein
MKRSQILESVDVIAPDGWGDFGLQHNSGRDQDVVSEDDLPTLEELLRLTLRKKGKVLIGEPKKAEHALQRADQQVWPRLVDVCHSQGRDGEGDLRSCRLQG